MDQAGLWLLVFLGVSGGALAQTCLDEKVFVFPKPSENACVLLKPRLAQPLQQFTLCLKFYTDLTRSFSLFSCASKDHTNDILLFKDSPTEYHVFVGGQYHTYNVPGNPDRGNHWENICMTWNSTTGIIQLWIDRQALPRKGLARGHAISTNVVMILGQEQDSYGGSFEEQRSFVGEIAEVYMWDTVLPPEQLRRARWEAAPTPLVNWTALNFEIKGYILLEPALD